MRHIGISQNIWNEDIENNKKALTDDDPEDFWQSGDRRRKKSGVWDGCYGIELKSREVKEQHTKQNDRNIDEKKEREKWRSK